MKKELTPAITALIDTHIDKRGGITDYATLSKLYGKELTNTYIHRNSHRASLQNVMIVDKQNKTPPHKVSFIITDKWNGVQPEWYTPT